VKKCQKQLVSLALNVTIRRIRYADIDFVKVAKIESLKTEENLSYTKRRQNTVIHLFRYIFKTKSIQIKNYQFVIS